MVTHTLAADDAATLAADDPAGPGGATASQRLPFHRYTTGVLRADVPAAHASLPPVATTSARPVRAAPIVVNSRHSRGRGTGARGNPAARMATASTAPPSSRNQRRIATFAPPSGMWTCS